MASKTGTAILLPENEEQTRRLAQASQTKGQTQGQQPEWDTEEMLSMGIDNEGHPVSEPEGEQKAEGSQVNPENTDLYGAMTEEFD